MDKTIEQYFDLLKDETRAFAYLATTMEDGSPQLTIVWFNWDNGYILINSALGRVKDRNMRRDRRIAIVINDPKDPYRFIQVRGTVVEITEQGADDHIDALSEKYEGKSFAKTPGQVRVIYRISPDRVHGYG